ncbi:hypothetical protein [Proteiniclasticum ruminis]|uniref:hypothetical protein n=2 Tax=Proteiniclasticum ruminis TaxID=398199 RepID=UPI002898EDAA|nr:hypothetical protein [Proteiniclasticum ruminis]
MKKEEMDLTMAFTSIRNMRKVMEEYMNEIDKKNFESFCSEPYTVEKLDILKDLIGIIEKESGQSFSRMMWRD